MRQGDLDWTAIALAGDVGAVPEPVAAATPSTVHRWRPGKVSILLLAAWLAWEATGLLRVLTVGPPILEAIWESGR